MGSFTYQLPIITDQNPSNNLLLHLCTSINIDPDHNFCATYLLAMHVAMYETRYKISLAVSLQIF